MNASRIQGSSGSAKDSIIHRNGSGLPGDSDSRESAFDVGGLSSIPGLGRSPRGGHGNPHQFSCLENPHGQRSLVGRSPWCRKESDTSEPLSTESPFVPAPQPQYPRAMWKEPGGIGTCRGFYYRWTLNLGNPNLIECEGCLAFAPEKDIIFTILDRKQTCPWLWRRHIFYDYSLTTQTSL